MATEKGKAAFEYMMKKMKDDPKATYADVAAACKKAGHSVFPIMWGRAQALLGRVKMKPRGQGKAAMAKAAKAGGVSSGAAPTGKRRGRPPGSKNKSTLARMAAAGGGGRRRATFGAGNASLAVSAADLANAQALVDALNGGGRAALRYEGGGWVISAA